VFRHKCSAVYRFREALEAAEYAVARAEASLDDALGRRTRIMLGRCASAAALGTPVAWFAAGMHWNAVAFGGLAAGVGLFALIDAVRSRPRGPARGDIEGR
jgi:hypothetical protein